MPITRTHPFTGEINTIEIPCTMEQLKAWSEGMLAQNAFSDCNADEREYIISGIPVGDWDKLFKEG